MKKLAQIPGMETMPTGGMPPMGEPAPPQPTFKIIYSPLDSLGKILADLDFKTFLQNHFGDNARDLAMKIWEMYGGDPEERHRGKKGERKDKPASDDMAKQSEAQQQEYNATRDERWRRLPLGVSIDEITNTSALERAITGGFMTLSKGISKPATASTVENIIKIANLADIKNQHFYADKLDIILQNVYTP